MDLHSDKPRTSDESTMEFTNDTTSILEMLNNDCLFHILAFLDVPELIVAERVCKRFLVVAKQIYKTYKELNFDYEIWCRQFALSEAAAIASRLGQHIHTFRAASYSFRNDNCKVPDFIPNHLKKLRNIHLERFEITDEETIKKLAVAFRGVTIAKLDSCDVTDQNLMALLKIDQLEVLELPKNTDIHGAFLANLTTSIREINLDGCSSVSPSLFRQFCEEHPNLRSLNVCDCNWVDKNCLRSVAANLKSVEKITISGCYRDVSSEDYLLLADLPKLKHLDISGFSDNPIAVTNMNVLLSKISMYNRLESLDLTEKMVTEETEKALKKLTNLKVLNLSLSSNCSDSTLEKLSCSSTLQDLKINYSDVTSHGVEMLIQKCPSLRLVNLFGCNNVDRSLISQILGHIRNRSHMLELMVDWGKFHTEDFENFHGVNPTKLKLSLR